MWQSSSPWAHSSTSAKEHSKLLVRCSKPFLIWSRLFSSFTSCQPNLLHSSPAKLLRRPWDEPFHFQPPVPRHSLFPLTRLLPHTPFLFICKTQLQSTFSRKPIMIAQCRWCPPQTAVIFISFHSTYHTGLSLLSCQSSPLDGVLITDCILDAKHSAWHMIRH